jgi:hypothetical protein
MNINHQDQISSPRSFGIVFSLFFIIIELYIFYSTGKLFIYLFPLSMILIVIAFLRPNLLKFPNYVWYRFGIMLGKLTNPIILFFIFYFLFFPISILVKIFKGSLLNKKFNHKITSYWEVREVEINTMKDQF